MRRRGAAMGRRRGPGLLGTAARTAVVAGTATAVVGGVSSRQQDRAQVRQLDGERQQAEAAAWQQQQVDAQVAAALAERDGAVPQPVPGGLSEQSIARLRQLAELVKQNILTEDEFAAQKAQILGSS